MHDVAGVEVQHAGADVGEDGGQGGQLWSASHRVVHDSLDLCKEGY